MRDNETAVQRLSRHLGLGKYGDKLAQEILDQYAAELAEQLREASPHFPHHPVCWGYAADHIDSASDV